MLILSCNFVFNLSYWRKSWCHSATAAEKQLHPHKDWFPINLAAIKLFSLDLFTEKQRSDLRHKRKGAYQCPTNAGRGKLSPKNNQNTVTVKTLHCKRKRRRSRRMWETRILLFWCLHQQLWNREIYQLQSSWWWLVLPNHPRDEKRLKERQSCPTATHSRLDESQCRGKNQTLIVEESGVWTQGFSSLKLL